MKTHELKTLPEYFEEVRLGNKTFEVRKNDSGFAVGDTLILKEWNGEYTGRQIVKEVRYLLDNPEYVKEGFVIMSLID